MPLPFAGPRLMAGDMLWPIVHPLNDDGFRSTHFGYEWSPEDPFSKDAIAQDLLPEVHVWAAMLAYHKGNLGWNVIDFSTKYFKKIAIEHHGLTWETAEPPEYIFGEPPPGVVYRYNRAATEYVWKFILRKFNPQMPEPKDNVLV